jgi:hypothetical protein
MILKFKLKLKKRNVIFFFAVFLLSNDGLINCEVRAKKQEQCDSLVHDKHS